MRSNKLLDFKINKIVRSVLNEENEINSKKEIKIIKTYKVSELILYSS
jgi:hypothetical protein